MGPEKVGVEEWIVLLVQGMYANAQSVLARISDMSLR